MSKHVGIPIKVLHDTEGHTVTIELKNGEVYRGKLDEAEDNMNVHLSNCTKTAKDGRVSTLSKCVRLPKDVLGVIAAAGSCDQQCRPVPAVRSAVLTPAVCANPQLLFAWQPRALHGAAGHPEERALLQEDRDQAGRRSQPFTVPAGRGSSPSALLPRPPTGHLRFVYFCRPSRSPQRVRARPSRRRSRK